MSHIPARYSPYEPPEPSNISFNEHDHGMIFVVSMGLSYPAIGTYLITLDINTMISLTIMLFIYIINYYIGKIALNQQLSSVGVAIVITPLIWLGFFLSSLTIFLCVYGFLFLLVILSLLLKNKKNL